MTVELNHTIVVSRDQHAAARDLAGLLGLQPSALGHFDVVRLTNGVSLDFMDVPELPAQPMHLAFLVPDDTFDEIYGRILERDLPFWADPFHTRAQQLNHMNGGRGLYWDSPDGHVLEILTRP